MLSIPLHSNNLLPDSNTAIPMHAGMKLWKFCCSSFPFCAQTNHCVGIQASFPPRLPSPPSTLSLLSRIYAFDFMVGDFWQRCSPSGFRPVPPFSLSFRTHISIAPYSFSGQNGLLQPDIVKRDSRCDTSETHLLFILRSYFHENGPLCIGRCKYKAAYNNNSNNNKK